MATVEIIENGKTYIVTGDYPNGRHCKEIKNKGTAPQKRLKGSLQKSDMAGLNTPTGRLLKAVLCKLYDTDEAGLTKMAGE